MKFHFFFIGCDGVITDLVINGSTIIIGGEIKLCWNYWQNNSDVVVVNNVAIFNEEGWQDLGHDGFQGNVTRMILNKGTLYTIGKFNGLGYFQNYYQNSWQIVISIFLFTIFFLFNFFYFMFIFFIILFFFSSWPI